jgi:hypothetical protein
MEQGLCGMRQRSAVDAIGWDAVTYMFWFGSCQAVLMGFGRPAVLSG